MKYLRPWEVKWLAHKGLPKHQDFKTPGPVIRENSVSMMTSVKQDRDVVNGWEQHFPTTAILYYRWAGCKRKWQYLYQFLLFKKWEIKSLKHIFAVQSGSLRVSEYVLSEPTELVIDISHLFTLLLTTSRQKGGFYCFTALRCWNSYSHMDFFFKDRRQMVLNKIDQWEL